MKFSYLDWRRKMSKLTDCTRYEEVVQMVKDNGWNATEVCNKIKRYDETRHSSKQLITRENHEQVYSWLCQYQKEYHKGNKPSIHKDVVLELLQQGVSPTEIHKKLLLEDIEIALSTIYKYRKELNNE